MKLRPQFQLRFRDAGQFEDVRSSALAEGVPMNEWLLRRIENASQVREMPIKIQSQKRSTPEMSRRETVPTKEELEGRACKECGSLSGHQKWCKLVSR